MERIKCMFPFRGSLVIPFCAWGGPETRIGVTSEKPLNIHILDGLNYEQRKKSRDHETIFSVLQTRELEMSWDIGLAEAYLAIDHRPIDENVMNYQVEVDVRLLEGAWPIGSPIVEHEGELKWTR